MYSRQIVAAINQEVKDRLKDRRFSNSKYNGIATMVLRRNPDNSEETLPILVDQALEEFAGFDDNYDMVIYHRVENFVYSKAQGKTGGGFGDKENNDLCAGNYLMVVYGDRKNIELTQEDLATAIVASIPDSFNQSLVDALGLQLIQISVKSVNNNPQSVWASEFKGVAFSLPPEKMLFTVNYVVVIQYDKSCYEICKNC